MLCVHQLTFLLLMVCITFKVFKIQVFINSIENILGTLATIFTHLKELKRNKHIVHKAFPSTNMYAKYVTCVMIRIKLLTNIMPFRVNKGLHLQLFTSEHCAGTVSHDMASV